MTRRLPVGVFFALFTISGFAGLIYESIWSHYLKLFLGHAAYAQTLVLAIFMGGMAIGSWLVSRYTNRIRNLLMGYAFAELGIGILAIVFHRVFIGLTAWAFDSVMPALGGTGVDLFKWGLASILILPASILLGTTFPLMSAGIMRLYPESGGRSLSMLYFTNSFGASLGVLVSGFYLIDRFGLPGTILTAGLMNVTLALVVWAISKRLPEALAPAFTTGGPGDSASRKVVRAVLLLAFATGAASFIYEITWIRMLTLGLGASTHAFEVMLAAFILAMSLGAFWFRNRISSLGNDLGWLAGLLIAKAFLAVYAVWIYGDVLTFMGWMMQSLARSEGGYTLNTLAGMVASMVVMFPTAFCAGMTLPLATHVLTSRGMGEASIGKVYGANTAGCIVGAAFATHVGMELAGVKGLTGIGALLDVAVGLMLVGATVSRIRRTRSLVFIAVVLLVGAGVFFNTQFDEYRMASGVYRHGFFLNANNSVIQFYRDGKTATIAVIDTGTFRGIRTNGKTDANVNMNPQAMGSHDEATMVLAGALPLAMKPNAQLIANIGFGSGMTTHTLLGSPNIKELDTIEIERMMIEGARLFKPRNSRAYDDPRSKIHIEDAKTFFASHPRLYDIIVSEPSNPWVSGVSTLFSEEFYAQVKRYLKDDGILVQWVQAYEINPGLLSTIFQALGNQFGDYVVYRTRADLLVVATKAAKLPPLTDTLFSFPNVKAELSTVGYQDLGDLQAARVAARATLQPFFVRTGFPTNSDYFPVVDQRAPKARFKNETSEALPGIRDDLVPLFPILDGDWRTPLARIQSSGLNRPGRVNQALSGAEAIGVMLSGAASDTRSLTLGQRSAALLAHSLLVDCKGANAEWVEGVSEVARLSVPFLAQSDTAVLFDKALASRCFKSLDEGGQRHIRLLKAINERDVAGIHEHAVFLLRREPRAPEPEYTQYLLSALLGALATGHVDEARELRTQYGPRPDPTNPRRNLSYDVISAHIDAASGGGKR